MRHRVLVQWVRSAEHNLNHYNGYRVLIYGSVGIGRVVLAAQLVVSCVPLRFELRTVPDHIAPLMLLPRA